VKIDVEVVLFYVTWIMSLGFSLLVMTTALMLRFKKPDKNIKIIREGDR
jgi:hypothetical protein